MESPEGSIRPFDWVDNPTLEHILVHLPIDALFEVCRVSQRMASICRNVSFWADKAAHDRLVDRETFLRTVREQEQAQEQDLRPSQVYLFYLRIQPGCPPGAELVLGNEVCFQRLLYAGDVVRAFGLSVDRFRLRPLLPWWLIGRLNMPGLLEGLDLIEQLPRATEISSAYGRIAYRKGLQVASSSSKDPGKDWIRVRQAARDIPPSYSELVIEAASVGLALPAPSAVTVNALRAAYRRGYDFVVTELANQSMKGRDDLVDLAGQEGDRNLLTLLDQGPTGHELGSFLIVALRHGQLDPVLEALSEPGLVALLNREQLGDLLFEARRLAYSPVVERLVELGARDDRPVYHEDRFDYDYFMTYSTDHSRSSGGEDPHGGPADLRAMVMAAYQGEFDRALEIFYRSYPIDHPDQNDEMGGEDEDEVEYDEYPAIHEVYYLIMAAFQGIGGPEFALELFGRILQRVDPEDRDTMIEQVAESMARAGRLDVIRLLSTDKRFAGRGWVLDRLYQWNHLKEAQAWLKSMSLKERSRHLRLMADYGETDLFIETVEGIQSDHNLVPLYYDRHYLPALASGDDYLANFILEWMVETGT